MKIGQLLYKASKALGDYSGYYTKKQCVRISADIGKELIDLRRLGQDLTVDVLDSVTQKHIPKINLNIITDPSEYEQILMTAGYTKDVIPKILEHSAGQCFNFFNGKGIYIPNLSKENGASVFAHELEHHMFNEHTFWRKKFNQILEKIRTIYINGNNGKPDTIDTDKFNNSSKGIRKNFEKYIGSYFGLPIINKNLGKKNIGFIYSNVNDFLAGEYYKGLTSEKRIDAYIRAISRNLMHPANENSATNILAINRVFKDEVRAYKAEEIVNQYARGDENIGIKGLRSELYSKSIKVLRKEFWLALKYKISKNTKPKQTGLPINAHKQTRLAEQARQKASQTFVTQKPKPKIIWKNIQRES